MAKLKTGRHTSAIKAQRQNRTGMLRNRRVREDIRDTARELEQAIVNKDAAAIKKLTPEVAKLWDKAAKRNVVHWKTASRKKSRLAASAKKALA